MSRLVSKRRASMSAGASGAMFDLPFMSRYTLCFGAARNF
jgi:hypothetical protein